MGRETTFRKSVWSKKYYRENRETLLERSREWSKLNSDHLREYRKSRSIEKNEYINDYLSGHPCVDCGEDDVKLLVFDHVRGVRKRGVTSMGCVNSVKSEIEKCDVRCRICHAKRHGAIRCKNRKQCPHCGGLL